MQIHSIKHRSQKINRDFRKKNNNGNKRRRNPWLAELTVRKELSIPEIQVIQTGNDRIVNNKAKTSKNIWEKKVK